MSDMESSFFFCVCVCVCGLSMNPCRKSSQFGECLGGTDISKLLAKDFERDSGSW